MEGHMKDYFKIGEVSQLFNMNLRTLRYYDSIDLLKPEYIDEKTGYRYYSTKQFERLNTIKYLRALNMPIEKIKIFFENKDIEQLLELFREQQNEILIQQQKLKLIQQKIDNRISQINDALSSQYDVIEEKDFGYRRIAYIKKEIPIHDDLELPIRELQKHHHLNDIFFLGKVGVSISKEHLIHQQLTSFSSIFIFLEGNESPVKDEQYLKASRYLTIRFRGTHQKAKDSYQKLLIYIQEHDYQIDGDSIELTLIDYGITNDINQFVTEIQIPIKKH